MISESEARQLLRDNKLERGIDDMRSCLEIAIARGLVEPVVEVESVDLQEAQLAEDTVI